MTPRLRAEGSWLRVTSFGVLCALIVSAAILAVAGAAAAQLPPSHLTDRSQRTTARQHVEMMITWPGLVRLRLRAEVESDIFLPRDTSADSETGR